MNACREMLRHAVAVCTVASLAAAANATTITYSAGDINGGDSSRTSFTDGSITLTPFIGATPSTFNSNTGRLGNDDQGTNGQAFNDPDTDPNNGNEESLQFDFAADAGLSQIAWDFSRADGVSLDDGVTISGFAEDPLVFFTGRTENGAFALDAEYDSNTGTLFLDLPFAVAFAGQQGFANFARPRASAGQTLTLKVTDTDEAGAQLAIRSISYNLIPEPTSAAAALTFCAVAAMRRR